jgi:simple sugar transport system substrate-binding protein
MTINFRRLLRGSRRRWPVLASCALTGACLAALSVPASSAVLGPTSRSPQATSSLTYFVNFEGGAEIPFYAVIEKGVVAAAQDLHIHAVFQAPPCPDGDCSVVAQAQLLDAEIADHPSGIAVQYNNASLAGGIERAVAAGIKVILVNTQNFAGAQAPAVIQNAPYVGEDELTTGATQAQNLLPYLHPGDSVLCINPGPSQIVQTVRCNALKTALAAHGISSTQLIDTSGVPSQGEAIVGGYLLDHPKTAAIVTLNAETADYATQIIQQRHLKILVTSYAIAPNLDADIQSGLIKFSLDQQPFVQGYMSVVDLYLWGKYGMTPSSVNTGSIIVNKSNVAQFNKLAVEGIGG